MKFRLNIVWILLLLWAAASPARAQAPALTLRLERLDTTGYPQFSAQISAWDDSGLPLSGLQASDFTLQEDVGPAFHPESLAADDRAPLWVVLVIDISGSMNGQPINDARIAAARFLDHLDAQDHAALIAFSGTVDVDPQNLDPQSEIGFTTNHKPIYDLVEGLTASGETQLYNAVSKAARLFESAPEGHRAILVLSDGKNDPPNVGDPEQPLSLARSLNVPVFVIGLGPQIDEPYLRRLANETGGVLRIAPSSSELAGMFSDTATLLKTQYRLAYTSNLPADGKTHTLTVTLNTGGLSASASLESAPLPLIPTATAVPPTATPAPTSTPLPATPTAVPTVVEPTSPPATPTPPQPEPEASVPWLPIGAVGLVALIGVIWFVASKAKPPTPELQKCHMCGKPLPENTDICLQCKTPRGQKRR